ncbi:imm11 family protein [Ruegeria atlantica]|uniref:imm11 family protein n=1 Tax=Ruegeria atlantica TaxID=81569 RepID=UPI002494A4DE|nr:DUF1629 domain-containing protein [Ruegeria atlantica]
MPWILHESISDQEDVTWALRNPSTGADRTTPKIYMPTVEISEGEYPLDFQQTSSHTELTDFMRGGSLGVVLVSQAFRDLIEEMDPGHSLYYPVVLHCDDGRIIKDEYFLHKFSDFIDDGVIVDESDVQPVVRKGKIRFYSSSAWPKLVWRSDRIKDRHVFSDSYLRDRFCVSDAFLEAAEDKGFKGFQKIESFIHYVS